MAGGSQIIINSDGIKIITPAKFEAKAGQHLFESGEKVVTPQTVLPTAPDSYSHKVNYQFAYTDGAGNHMDAPENLKQQVFVIENTTSKLIAQRDLSNPKEDTTLRFHTSESKPFTAFLFKSEGFRFDSPDDPFFNEDEIDHEASFDHEIPLTDEDE